MFLGSSCCNIAENSTFARPLDFACRLNPSFHAFAEACATETLGAYLTMAEFVKRGGRIAVAPKSLQEDEYGKPLAADFATEPAASTAPAVLTEQIHRSGVEPLPVELKVAHAEGNNGIFFRMVPDGKGDWLVNLVNYNFDPRRVRLEGDGEWSDLIRERGFQPEFELAPHSCRLIELK